MRREPRLPGSSILWTAPPTMLTACRFFASRSGWRLTVKWSGEWSTTPTSRRVFTARRGQGAFLNHERIQVSKVSPLGVSLLATGFPYDIRTSERNNLNYFREFALRAQAVRRVGSAALDLCYVGCGRFDGFWELKLNPWDCAAGCLVVQEGGGRVTDFRGAAMLDIRRRVCGQQCHHSRRNDCRVHPLGFRLQCFVSGVFASSRLECARNCHLP